MTLPLLLAAAYLAAGPVFDAPAASRVVSADAVVQQVWEQSAPHSDRWLVLLKAEVGSTEDGFFVSCRAVLMEMPRKKLAGTIDQRVDVVGNVAKLSGRATEACVGGLAEDFGAWLKVHGAMRQ